ncbi:hypothetical protein B0J11DRAFT_585783 [Dendryphion nanum]|uniref:Uncharacterized protein n=1 Tax=Dendryphion nanum TaxID=256645 RepID=A0A9P9D1R3_9PLEO|nr:hypothetical protein B0J11DRAFT_585783 [Dendryphion nanum]
MNVLRKAYTEKSARNRALDLRLEAVIRQYSRVWNIAFATYTTSSLPQELCDLIYAEIWTEGYILGTCHMMVGTLQGLNNWPVPHVVDASFVGREVALGVVAAYYVAAPHFVAAFDPCQLHQIACLVYDDVFKVGLKPETVLRAMNIKLKMGCLVLKNEPDYTPLEEIELSFLPLLDIKRQEGFNLNIELSQRHIRISIWREFIDMLRPIILQIESMGASVDIIWSYDGRGGGLFDEPIPFSKEIQNSVRHSIQQPRSDWKEHLIQHLDSEPMILDYHRDYRHEESASYVSPDAITDDEDEIDNISNSSL